LNQVYLRKNIIRYLAKHSGYSQAVCEDILNAYHSLMVEVVENGDRMEDFGYINLETKFVPEHYRGNPQDNNIKVKVQDKYKVKLTAGKTLKDASKKTINNINK
jgi:nucleoid DNA-binding protein